MDFYENSKIIAQVGGKTSFLSVSPMCVYGVYSPLSSYSCTEGGIYDSGVGEAADGICVHLIHQLCSSSLSLTRESYRSIKSCSSVGHSHGAVFPFQ